MYVLAVLARCSSSLYRAHDVELRGPACLHSSCVLCYCPSPLTAVLRHADTVPKRHCICAVRQS